MSAIANTGSVPEDMSGCLWLLFLKAMPYGERAEALRSKGLLTVFKGMFFRPLECATSLYGVWTVIVDCACNAEQIRNDTSEMPKR